METYAIIAQQENPPVEETGNGDGNGGIFGGGLTSLIPLVLIFGLMYLILIRPQRKQEKQRREMISQMSKSDRVVTIGGIEGIVYSIDDDGVVLKVDERNDVRLRVAKSAVARVLSREEQQQ